MFPVFLMSTTFGRGGANPGTTAADTKGTATGEGLDDLSYEAAAEHPPGLKLSIGIIELIVGGAANVAQVSTSTVAWISKILANPAPSLMATTEVSKSFPWIIVVSLGIALIVQTTLHMHGQAISSTWTRLRHIQNFHIPSMHAAKDVAGTVSLRTIFGLVALAMDVVSDATFINLITRDRFVILVWIAMLTGGATLLLYDGATRVWGAMEDYKDYNAFHLKHDAPKEKK
jgi:hypothetical protein